MSTGAGGQHAGFCLTMVSALMPDWQAYLALETPAETVERLQRHERTGQPLGGERFLRALGAAIGQRVRPNKPGRPKNKSPDREKSVWCPPVGKASPHIHPASAHTARQEANSHRKRNAEKLLVVHQG